jgi:hypothetical protein
MLTTSYSATVCLPSALAEAYFSLPESEYIIMEYMSLRASKILGWGTPHPFTLLAPPLHGRALRWAGDESLACARVGHAASGQRHVAASRRLRRQ